MRVLLTSLYPYIFLALYVSIPFDNYFRALPNILLGILVAVFLIIVKKSDFLKLKKSVVIPLLCMLACMVIFSLVGERFAQDWPVIDKVLLAIGIALLYLPVRDMTQVNNAVIFSSLAAITFSLVNMFILVNISEDVALDFPRQVVEALLIDRLYLGMLAIFSILISYQLISRKYHPNNRYYLANIIVNILFIGLMLSKVALIVLLILMVLKQFYERRWFIRSIAALAIAVLLAMLVVLPLSKPRDNDQTRASGSIERLLENTFTWELRRTVWGCASNLVATQPLNLLGYGVNMTKQMLVDCYDGLDDQRQRQEFLIGRYNTHNQFVDLYLSFGLPVLLLFIAFLILAFFWNRRHFFPTAFLVVLAVFCLVENVFYRQIGSYYVGLMLIVILTTFEFSNNKRLENHD